MESFGLINCQAIENCFVSGISSRDLKKNGKRHRCDFPPRCGYDRMGTTILSQPQAWYLERQRDPLARVSLARTES